MIFDKQTKACVAVFVWDGFKVETKNMEYAVCQGDRTGGIPAIGRTLNGVLNEFLVHEKFLF